MCRLFYTKDPQTDQTRTTDHWVQTPGYWIRMVHTERDDLIDPDNCPSPLSSADAIAFGDTLNAEGTHAFSNVVTLSKTVLRLMISGVTTRIKLVTRNPLRKIPVVNFRIVGLVSLSFRFRAPWTLRDRFLKQLKLRLKLPED